MPDPTVRSGRLARAKSIFQSLVGLEEGEREDVLSKCCRGDPRLEDFARKLLDNDPDLGTFLERPDTPSDDEIRQLDEAATRALEGRSDSTAEHDVVGRAVSHYRVQERLGAGGMGEVYLAYDQALGRSAALKLLPTGFKKSLRERLVREAWASAKVQHPAIATFYEAGRADDVDFIAMEYVPGRTLRDRLTQGAIPIEEATVIVETVLEALVHAHFSGILHRDIKPENIMLSDDGGAKVLDFGLARAFLPGDEDDDERAASVEEDAETPLADDVTAAETCLDTDAGAGTPDAAIGSTGVAELTRPGAVMGTPGYMAPEQLRGETADDRTDVFAVGAVLYEILAGQPAFPGRTVHERFRSILHDEPPPLAGGDTREALNAVVARALAKDRSARFPSASAFLAELRRVTGRRSASTERLAVAPIDFDNRSRDDEKTWLESELPDTIVSALVRIPGVASVPRPKIAKLIPPDQELGEVEIGLRLGCDAVLTGAFEAKGSVISVHIRMTEVATGDFLEDTITGPLEEIFSIRDRFVALVAAHFGLEISNPERSTQFEAYEHYGRAKRIGQGAQRAAFEEVRELLENAVSIDPGFARALAQLAQTYAMRYHYTSDPSTVERAIHFGRRAIEADSSLAEAHLWLGYAMIHAGRMLEGLRALREAMRFDPTSFLPVYFSAGPFLWPKDLAELEALLEVMGGEKPDDVQRWRFEQAAHAYQRSVHLNPAFAWGWAGLGIAHLELGNFAEAESCFRRAIELSPTTVPMLTGGEGFLGECLRRRGNYTLAREEFSKGLEALEKSDHMYRDTLRGLFLCGIGRTALETGDAEAARAAFHQAVLLEKGRPARCGGHVLVQALAGMTRSSAGEDHFGEALELFRSRQRFDFTCVWGCTDEADLLELSRAARTLERTDLAEELFREALARGSGEARHELEDGRSAQ